MENSDKTKCSCGHQIGNSQVEKELSYSWWGWFLLYNGISTTPKKVSYRCAICRETVKVVTDYEIIKKTYRAP